MAYQRDLIAPEGLPASTAQLIIGGTAGCLPTANLLPTEVAAHERIDQFSVLNTTWPSRAAGDAALIIN
jgi:hypothetical protein